MRLEGTICSVIVPDGGSGAWVNNVLTKHLIYRGGIMQPKQLLERCARARATDLGLGQVTKPIIPKPSYFFVF